MIKYSKDEEKEKKKEKENILHSKITKYDDDFFPIENDLISAQKLASSKKTDIVRLILFSFLFGWLLFSECLFILQGTQKTMIQWTKTKDLGEGTFGKSYKGINKINNQIIGSFFTFLFSVCHTVTKCELFFSHVVIKEIVASESSVGGQSEEERLELIEQIRKDIEIAKIKLRHHHLVCYLGIEYYQNVLYIFREYVFISKDNINCTV